MLNRFIKNNTNFSQCQRTTQGVESLSSNLVCPAGVEGKKLYDLLNKLMNFLALAEPSSDAVKILDNLATGLDALENNKNATNPDAQKFLTDAETYVYNCIQDVKSRSVAWTKFLESDNPLKTKLEARTPAGPAP